MATAIPPVLRRRIVELCESGHTAIQVSQLLGLAYPGVAKIWRTYRRQGPSVLELGYSRCGRKPIYDPLLRAEIDEALVHNPDLGAPIIRSRLLAENGQRPIPHERTIQRWWRQQGKNNPRGRRPKSHRTYAQQPHHTWQVDAKERVRLLDGSQHCYLSFTDEATCSFLQGWVFPLDWADPTS